MSHQNQDSDLRSLFARLAKVAAAETLPRFRAKRSITNKSENGFDPVTEADKEAEIRIREVLREVRGTDSVIGEEGGRSEGTSGWTWVLDPIDGTRSFITSQPTWGTLIGLQKDGITTWGMMDQPFTGERYLGGPGFSELQHNGEIISLKTRKCSELSSAHIVLPSLYRRDYRPDISELFREIAPLVELVRAGGDCYRYVSIAHGQLDAIIDRGLRTWDIEPLLPIVEGAGGILTQWNGSPATDHGTIVCCGDPELHSILINILREYHH
jgi:myo-inositol-1(or 4)-monophosphatase